MSRLPRAIALVVSALACALACASVAEAQVPSAASATTALDAGRPALKKDRDTNDWHEYYQAGLKLIERQLPKSADPYFLWAARLNPEAAEPVHMHWVAQMILSGRLLEIEPGKGNAKEEAQRARIDSVLLEALRIDPFTPRHYARYVYEALPGYWGEDDFTRGYLAYTEGSYERAARMLARITKGDRVRSAHMFRALSFYELQRYDSAAAELTWLADFAARENATKLTRSYEGIAVYLYGIGVARMRLGDLDAARAALLRALDEDVSLAAAHVALAQVAMRRADTAEVLREWQAALELRPSSAAVHGNFATALHLLGRREEAVAEYEQAISLEPLWAVPYFNEALVLDAMGRGADAVTRYAQFIERAPRAYEAQLRRARERIGALNGGR